MKRIIFLALITLLNLNASRECKEQAESAHLDRESEVAKLISELNVPGAYAKWSNRKRIIARLIQVYGINPNNIKYNHGTKPLSEAVSLDDIFFASFLLNHGADPNANVVGYSVNGESGRTILTLARSKLMAQRLFGHGAQITEGMKESILSLVSTHGYEPSLIPLYIQHGANVEGLYSYGANVEGLYSYGRTPLIVALQSSKKLIKQYVAELLKAGALVSTEMRSKFESGWNAAMILKEQLDSAVQYNISLDEVLQHRNKEKIESLQEIRAMMKQAYEAGECRVKREAIEVHMIPDLANMCVNSYEDLERLPAQGQ